MWVFAILVVLVLGGIAAVAAGKGAPLDPVYDDRPDTVVPAEGPLAGPDLRRVRFPLALRGYRMSDVDALLDRLATQLEERPEEQPEEQGRAEPQESRPPAPEPGEDRSA